MFSLSYVLVRKVIHPPFFLFGVLERTGVSTSCKKEGSKP